MKPTYTDDAITDTAYRTTTASLGPLSEEHRLLLQSLVDLAYVRGYGAAQHHEYDCSMKGVREVEKLRVQLDAVTQERNRYRAALAEITQGKGTFSLDHFTHAKNCIDEMKQLAVEALADRSPAAEGETP